MGRTDCPPPPSGLPPNPAGRCTIEDENTRREEWRKEWDRWLSELRRRVSMSKSRMQSHLQRKQQERIGTYVAKQKEAFMRAPSRFNKSRVSAAFKPENLCRILDPLTARCSDI